ncbi:unnamed protein product [Leptidea sinapis]|uniref:ADP-ribosylation factor-like protein 4C n=1 Tax=Leptidea sinapis TaxID=189913 RepID=A0A5E4Q099_9NEOP|nr:unnamed protein product [Leptidea sinapis]
MEEEIARWKSSYSSTEGSIADVIIRNLIIQAYKQLFKSQSTDSTKVETQDGAFRRECQIVRSMGANMGKNSSLLDALPSTQGTLHVVMLGLDSAGKTTALYRLKFDQYLNTVPTIGFNCEKVKGTIGKSKDSVDVERMEEAKMELIRTAKSPDNAGVPILVLANKQDLPGAKEPRELEKLLGLHELVSSPHGSRDSHAWHVQPACAITGEGLHEGLEALYEMILKRRKLAKLQKKRVR